MKSEKIEMNNRFKFRQWAEQTKTMLYNIEQTDDVCLMEYLVYGNVMQCTGLKDKNGKLIYERDILKDDKGLLYLVEFISQKYTTSFNLKRIEIPNYYPHITTLCGLGYKNRNNYEVIGNCYENPELLSHPTESEGENE